MGKPKFRLVTNDAPKELSPLEKMETALRQLDLRYPELGSCRALKELEERTRREAFYPKCFVAKPKGGDAH